MTGDRPTIDRDALTALLDRTHYTNVAGGEGGDILSSLTRAVDDLLDALDAETRRADAADLADEAIIEQRDAARAERDSLGERIAAVEAEVERLREGWNVPPVPSLLALVVAENERLYAERDALGERIAAVRALCDDPDTPHAGSCASYRAFRTADGPYPCDCIVSQIRRALADTDAARIARETT
jgi:hypothetical protein